MPFNTAAALERIKSKSPEPAISAISAIREEIQQDDAANPLLIGCYSGDDPVETTVPAAEDAQFPAVQPPLDTAPAPSPARQTAPKKLADVGRNVLPFNPHRDTWEPQPGDAEAYADALRHNGPSGYGGIAMALRWGVSRASAAETELRRAGRLVYDKTGRAVLVEDGGGDDDAR